MNKVLSIWLFRLLSICTLYLAFPCYGQEITVKHFTENDGLPSSTVYSAFEDKQGFLWFATPAGVSRFDGRKFINYSHNDGLGENEILRIAEDSKNRVWFLGLNGTLSYFLNGRFFNSGNDGVLAQVSHTNSFFNFFEDKYGRLWFMTLFGCQVIDNEKTFYFKTVLDSVNAPAAMLNASGPGIYLLGRHKIATREYILYNENKIQYIPARYTPFYANGYTYLHDSSILFKSVEGVVRQKDTAQTLILPLDKRLTDIDMKGLLLSSDSLLWLSFTGEGLYCYNYKNLSAPPKIFLKKTLTVNVIEDHEGNIWVGTLNDGVYEINNWHGNVRNYTINSGITEANTYSVAEDNEHTLYAGMPKGKAAIIGHESIQQVLLNPSTTSNDRILKILPAHGCILFVTDEGMIYFKNKERINYQIPSGYYYAQMERSRVFAAKDVCLYKQGIAICESRRILVDTGFFMRSYLHSMMANIDPVSERKFCVFADKKNTLWYSTTSGLWSWDGEKKISHPRVNQLITEKIISISETLDSTLVLATYGHGTLFYKNGKVQAILNEKNGLANNICKRVFVHKDLIYVATVKGLTRAKYNNGRFYSIRQYNTSNGLVSNDINDVYANDTDICVATEGGITVVNANANEQAVTAPPLFITTVKCNDSVFSTGKSYHLNYKQNRLHFEYIGISYRAANDIHYQYRLNNGQEWIATDNTSLDFPYLPPGRYRFQLRARILNGPWSGVKTFVFIIRPPFWRTWGFIIPGIILSILLVGLIVYLRIRKVHARHNEELKIKNQIVTLEQQALQAMMNPHFIFNVMNSIQHYINNNNAHEANIYLSDFARLIRMNLDISAKRHIPLDEEIAYLELYLSLERLRFGNRLTYEVYVDPEIDTDETVIPVMLLQPFIENALWHGILPMKGNGHVKLDIRKDKEHMLKIEITDNGVGMPAADGGNDKKIKTHESKGMKMTRHRLDLIGKISGHKLYLNLHDAFPGQENKGTKVELLIPGDFL